MKIFIFVIVAGLMWSNCPQTALATDAPRYNLFNQLHQNSVAMNSQTEIWKDVIGFESLYQVSNLGNVRSLNRFVAHPKGGRRIIIGKPAGLSVTQHGYMQVSLSKNGKNFSKRVNVLVAQAFIPNPENKPQVNHINGVKIDNWVENLEWVTPSENTKHAYSYNLRTAPSQKALTQFDREGNKISDYSNICEASRQTKVDRKSISRVCNGGGISAGGYYWKFKNDSEELGQINPQCPVLLHESPVAQFTLGNTFIAEYKSMALASRITNIPQPNISKVCNGIRGHAGGFLWKLKSS